ncbi:hypothetical protein ACFLSS_01705 [Bacteroidota bacterium]
MDEFQSKIESFHKKEKRIRRVTLALVIAPVLIGTIWMYVAYKEVNQLNLQKEQIIVQYDSVKYNYEVLVEKKVSLEAELMENYGLSRDIIQNLSTSEILEISLSADEVIKKLSLNYVPGSNIIVRYYNKTIDEERVVIALRSLGYKFKSKNPVQYMQKQQTNSVWFGRQVPLKDCKIIALTLMRAGIPIKAIRPYRASLTNPSYKKNIVEVGGDTGLRNNRKLTVEEVTDATEFTR